MSSPEWVDSILGVLHFILLITIWSIFAELHLVHQTWHDNLLKIIHLSGLSTWHPPVEIMQVAKMKYTKWEILVKTRISIYFASYWEQLQTEKIIDPWMRSSNPKNTFNKSFQIRFLVITNGIKTMGLSMTYMNQGMLYHRPFWDWPWIDPNNCH